MAIPNEARDVAIQRHSSVPAPFVQQQTPPEHRDAAVSGERTDLGIGVAGLSTVGTAERLYPRSAWMTACVLVR